MAKENVKDLIHKETGLFFVIISVALTFLISGFINSYIKLNNMQDRLINHITDGAYSHDVTDQVKKVLVNEHLIPGKDDEGFYYDYLGNIQRSKILDKHNGEVKVDSKLSWCNKPIWIPEEKLFKYKPIEELIEPNIELKKVSGNRYYIPDDYKEEETFVVTSRLTLY